MIYYSEQLFSQARLPALHAEQLVAVLEKFADQPQRLGDLQGEYFSTVMFDETAAQRDGTTKRQTQYPDNASQWILSGPHFFVGTPFYKTPRANCTLNSDYDCLDLLTLPDDYLPRTNYIPACDAEEYARRTPRVSWTEPGEDQPKKVTEYYRLVFRKMLSQSGERTLISSIEPKGFSHIFSCVSVAFKNIEKLIELTALFMSVTSDFYVKSTGKANLTPGEITKLPLLNLQSSVVSTRVLSLNSLNIDYKSLWQSCYQPEFREFNFEVRHSPMPPDGTLRIP